MERVWSQLAPCKQVGELAAVAADMVGSRAMARTRCADEDVCHAHFYVSLDPAIGIDDSRGVVRDELGIDAHTPARPLQTAWISAGIRVAPSGGPQIALSDGRGLMSMTTILVIVVVVLLLGGGGYYWRR